MALTLLSEADDKLTEIERGASEVLIAKGVRDVPEVLTGDVLRSQVAEDKVQDVIVKGFAPPPQIGVQTTSTGNAAVNVDSRELEQTRNLVKSMTGRLIRAGAM